METWRLLDTGHRSAAENMALDEVILTARSKGWVPNTLRFLQFSPRCTLVGYHQAVEQEIRVAYCQQHGIEINRRLTGGGALFWDETQIGWEIFASQRDPRFALSPEALYERLCQGAVRGLEKLGIRAAFRPRNDIEVRGRKISGTGGTSMDGAFLFQGTLLVDFDVDTMLRALWIPTEKLKDKEIASVRERVTCLAWELPTVPPSEEIKAALAEGFAEVLGVRFDPAPLSPAEEDLLARRLPFFRSDEWIYGTRRPLSRRGTLRALYKSPGGLIRVSLIVDYQMRYIREAFITGDFFAYPRRAILDLEAALKGAPIDDSALRATVENFFTHCEAHIPGVSPADIVRTLQQALEKIAYTAYGIGPEEVNSVFSVVRPLPEIMDLPSPQPPALLLPYCAKMLTCPLRYQEGCTLCGGCDISEAYHIAEKYGLRPITIQNYEMLEAVLRELRRNGATFFVGTCCEAFYAKHRDDFERIGLPGILVDVDNTTCYDLGREEDAYRGRFDKQTSLKLDLLERVVAQVSKNGRTG